MLVGSATQIRLSNRITWIIKVSQIPPHSNPNYAFFYFLLPFFFPKNYQGKEFNFLISALLDWSYLP